MTSNNNVPWLKLFRKYGLAHKNCSRFLLVYILTTRQQKEVAQFIRHSLTYEFYFFLLWCKCEQVASFVSDHGKTATKTHEMLQKVEIMLHFLCGSSNGFKESPRNVKILKWAVVIYSKSKRHSQNFVNCWPETAERP
jgi:hypothetical protein